MRHPSADTPAYVVLVRCLWCATQKELMSTDDWGLEGFVSIGFNLYYCSDCARKTGYTSKPPVPPSCGSTRQDGRLDAEEVAG